MFTNMIVICLIHLILAICLYTAPYYNFKILPASWGGEWRGCVVLTCNVYGYIFIIDHSKHKYIN